MLRRYILKYLILILCLCVSAPFYIDDSHAFEPGIGVVTHFMRYFSDTKHYQMLNKVGAHYIRDELTWQRVEQIRGKFILDPRMSKYIDQLNALNIKPIMILDYSNINYAKGFHAGPNTPELRKAFGDYAAFMVSTLKGKVYAWEIWNEPDHGFWLPSPNSKDYSLLVKTVAPIIRKIDPQSLIVAGALTHPDWKYLKSLQEEGALTDVDVISFHWYTHPKPPDQGWAPIKMDLTSVRAFVQAIKRLGKRAWITEMGYPTSTDRYGVSEAQQAEYLQKQLELAKNMGVEVCIIYDLIDDGPNAGDKEHRFGLFRQDGTAKSAVSALPRK